MLRVKKVELNKSFYNTKVGSVVVSFILLLNLHAEQVSFLEAAEAPSYGELVLESVFVDRQC